MYRYLKKMQTYWLLLVLMVAAIQSCRCAEMGLEVKAVQSYEQKENPETAQQQKIENVLAAAGESIGEHVAPKQETPSESPKAPSDEDSKEDDSKEEEKLPVAPQAPAKKDDAPAQEPTKEQAQPNILYRAVSKVGNGLVTSKNAVFGAVGTVCAAVASGTVKSGKFVLKTVNPLTYWNAGKDVLKGQEGVSRFEIIKGHQEAVTGIVAATLATVGYVYYDEIVDCSKKAYNWTKDQVQSFKAYIQG